MKNSKNKTCPFMQGHWGCVVKFLCENFKYFVIGGSIILAAIAYGCFSKTAKDKCYYKNYRMKYQELKKINPALDKWASKAEASRFALKACNIK
jgi:hypothetical protein